LRINEQRGDTIRAELFRKTRMVLDALNDLEISTPNSSGFPIIEVPLANHDEIDEVGRFLFDRGIYTTIAAYPLVPKAEVGFRIQITAANEDSQLARLIETLAELSTRFRLQTAYTMSRWWEGANSPASRASR
jgi:8-amino-7-oxononanoate synthase